jgi:hypothetical protein
VDDMTAYYCTSRIGGRLPKVGPLYHASVAFCPRGELPVVCKDGQLVSNPHAVYFGTQPSVRGFLLETEERHSVRYRPAGAPAHVVLERVLAEHRRWWLLLNNCKHAARRATRP